MSGAPLNAATSTWKACVPVRPPPSRTRRPTSKTPAAAGTQVATPLVGSTVRPAGPTANFTDGLRITLQ